MIVSLCRQDLSSLYSISLGKISVEEITARGGVLFHSPVGVLAIVPSAGEDTREVVRWLEEYFGGKRPEWMPELNLSGTPFQLRVWTMLCEIPYGQTTSYGALADRLSFGCGIEASGSGSELQHPEVLDKKCHKMSPQAVGHAVGANPCCILIPCHRVIASSGALGGYAHGPAIKKALLDFECSASLLK